MCHCSCDHGCCLVGAKMYVSSGSGGENIWYNDLYYLDLQTLEWTRLEMEGDSPQPRDYLTLSSLSSLVSYYITAADANFGTCMLLRKLHLPQCWPHGTIPPPTPPVLYQCVCGTVALSGVLHG